MALNVVYLAYANSESTPLPNLSWEDEMVFAALANDHLRGRFTCYRESLATVEKINTGLQKCGDHVAVFHFSGHAGPLMLRLGDALANAAGIPAQLKPSIDSGVLKLVVLNGCSTRGQVGALLDAGVPAVIATNAPAGDKSAATFAVRFYQNLCEGQMTIREAFTRALGPAQLATAADLDIGDKAPRNIGFFKKMEDNKPIWELFCQDEAAVDISPLIPGEGYLRPGYTPNKELSETTFNALLASGNKAVEKIIADEKEGIYVEVSDKYRAIVNALPFPIGIHLQKLFSLSEDTEAGYDTASLVRIEQIAEVYHISMEFVGFVMLSQLWELKLRGVIEGIPEPLLSDIRNYFYLPGQQRQKFNYLPLIRTIRTFFDSLNDGAGIEYFMSELSTLREIATEGHVFANACGYLADLRVRTIGKRITADQVPEICERAEHMLATVFSRTGFLHRYNLTSIQDIDILKPRHNLTAEFNHRAINLMRALGNSDKLYYRWSSYLDNQGVILLKGDLRVIDIKKRQFVGTGLKFLNLSPFVIDKNNFAEYTNLTNLMFFEEYSARSGRFTYKNVKKPDSPRDRFEISAEEKFTMLRSELEAFIELIQPQPVNMLP